MNERNELYNIGSYKTFGKFIYNFYKHTKSKLTKAFPDWGAVQKYVFKKSYILRLEECKSMKIHFKALIEDLENIKSNITSNDPDLHKLEKNSVRYLANYYYLIKLLFELQVFEENEKDDILQVLRTGMVVSVQNGVYDFCMWSPEILEALHSFYNMCRLDEEKIPKDMMRNWLTQFTYNNKNYRRFENVFQKHGTYKNNCWITKCNLDRNPTHEFSSTILSPTRSVHYVPLTAVLQKITDMVYEHTDLKSIKVAIIGDSYSHEELVRFVKDYRALHTTRCEVHLNTSDDSFLDGVLLGDEESTIEVIQDNLEGRWLNDTVEVEQLHSYDLVIFTDPYVLYKNRCRFTHESYFDPACVSIYGDMYRSSLEKNRVPPINELVNVLDILGCKNDNASTFDYNDTSYFEINMPLLNWLKSVANFWNDHKKICVIFTGEDSLRYESGVQKDSIKHEVWNGQDFYTLEFGSNLKSLDMKGLEDITQASHAYVYESQFTLFDLLSHLDSFGEGSRIWDPDVSRNIQIRIIIANKDIDIIIKCDESYVNNIPLFTQYMQELEQSLKYMFYTAFIDPIVSDYKIYIQKSLLNVMEHSVHSFKEAIQCSLFKNCYIKNIDSDTNVQITFHPVDSIIQERFRVGASASVDYFVVDNWIKILQCYGNDINLNSMIRFLFKKDAKPLQKYKLMNLKTFIDYISILYIGDFRNSGICKAAANLDASVLNVDLESSQNAKFE